MTINKSKLIQAAARARQRAVAPYSKFKVGAALLTKSGSIVSGANVESASYGLTCCAERVALRGVFQGAGMIFPQCALERLDLAVGQLSFCSVSFEDGVSLLDEALLCCSRCRFSFPSCLRAAIWIASSIAFVTYSAASSGVGFRYSRRWFMRVGIELLF